MVQKKEEGHSEELVYITRREGLAVRSLTEVIQFCVVHYEDTNRNSFKC